MSATTDIWKTKVASVRAARDASLAKVEPKLDGLPESLPINSTSLPKLVLSAKEREITENYTVKQLLAKLRDRSFSVEEVTRAFLRRAALAHAAVRPPLSDACNPHLWLCVETNKTRPIASLACSGTTRLRGRSTLIRFLSRKVTFLDFLFPRKSTMAWSATM